MLAFTCFTHSLLARLISSFYGPHAVHVLYLHLYRSAWQKCLTFESHYQSQTANWFLMRERHTESHNALLPHGFIFLILGLPTMTIPKIHRSPHKVLFYPRELHTRIFSIQQKNLVYIHGHSTGKSPGKGGCG